MTTFATNSAREHRTSVFTGADVCLQAGLTLPDDVRRPLFDDDLWDFTEVVGLAVNIPLANRRFDFAVIGDPRWRMVAKELIIAALAPRHPAVAELPRAYRTPLHLRSCIGRLGELTRLFRWLDRRHVTTLAEIDTHTCEAYLAFRRYILDEDGNVVGEQSPAVRRAAAQIIVDLVNHRDLFTADRVRADLRPWGGASASAVAEMRSGRDGNTTPAVPDEILQPMLAAALHLMQVLGPHAVALNQQVREHDRVHSVRIGQRRQTTTSAVDDIVTVLADYTRTGTPLPRHEDHEITKRLAAGWSADDLLLPVATGILARQAGRRNIDSRWLPRLRGPLTNAVAAVGVEKVFARDAEQAPTADGATRPWSLPLHRSQAVAVVGIVRTAAIIVLSASSGMRSSELMELRVGCRRPIEEPIPGSCATASPARSSKASRSAAPTTNGSSSNRSTELSNSSNNCTTIHAMMLFCCPGSASGSVTSGSATGSTLRQENAWAWPQFPRDRSHCGCSEERSRWNWPIAPAGFSQQNCSSSISQPQQPKAMRPGRVALKRVTGRGQQA